MAHPSPPPSQPSIILLALLLLLSATQTTTAAASSFQELDTMLQVLRNHGYTLFTNAIATSDVQYQLTTSAASETSTPPFTLFAPVDELLFALDMSADADAYVSTLRYHVIPNRRHTFADLRNLSSPFLETLLPHYSVLIGKIRDGYVDLLDNATVGVMVDGVRLSEPDLFLGSRIAAHGIDGILMTGLNMNPQFDGSGHFAPTGSPPAKPELDRNITSKGIPPPMNATVSPANHSNAKNPAAAPGILQDKADKSLAGKKKKQRLGRHGRGGRFCPRRRSRVQGRGHCHHRREDV